MNVGINIYLYCIYVSMRVCVCAYKYIFIYITVCISMSAWVPLKRRTLGPIFNVNLPARMICTPLRLLPRLQEQKARTPAPPLSLRPHTLVA